MLTLHIHLVDRICIGYHVLDAVLNIELIVSDSRIQFELVAMRCVQISFALLEVLAWQVGISISGLVILNDKGQVNESSELKLTLVHSEVGVHAIVLASLFGREHSEELVDSFARLCYVLLNCLDALH